MRFGIDLGGTKTEIMALAADGGVALRRRIATPRDYDSLLRAVVELVTGAGGPGLPAGEGAERVELAMTDQALTGFLAWIEAAPPGSHLGEILSAGQTPRTGSAAAAGTPQHVPADRVAVVGRPGQDEQQVG